MGTTRIKVFDLSSDEKEVKTSRKHAENLTHVAKVKKDMPQDNQVKSEAKQEVSQEQLLQTENLAENALLDQTPKEAIAENKPEPKRANTKSRKKPESLHHKGAKYQSAKRLVEDKNYPLTEAMALLPKTSYTKFDPTVEVHLNITEKNIKASVNMPFLKAENKQKKYLVFADKNTDLKDKPIIWADEKTISEIEKGSLKPGRDFDVVIASPKFMPTLATIAKVLGPKGLMPNPKNGTITDNVEKIIEAAADQTGTAIKTDPTGSVVHTKIGKLSQKTDELEANLKSLVLAIGLSKIQGATLTTTMGPAIKLDTSTLR